MQQFRKVLLEMIVYSCLIEAYDETEQTNVFMPCHSFLLKHCEQC